MIAELLMKVVGAALVAAVFATILHVVLDEEIQILTHEGLPAVVRPWPGEPGRAKLKGRGPLTWTRLRYHLATFQGEFRNGNETK